MSLSKYLNPRKGSPNLYVRLPVPTHLREVIGKTEIPRSMRTSDRKLAEKRAIKFIAEQQQRFEQLSLSEQSVAPANLNEKIVSVYYDNFVSELNVKTKARAIEGIEKLEQWAGSLRLQQSEWKRRLIAEDYTRAAELAENFLDKRGFQVERAGDGYFDLLRSITSAIIEALDVVIRRIEGGGDVAPRSAFIVGVKQQQGEKAKVGEKPSDYKEQYLKELIQEEKREPSNVEQYGQIIDLFIEWIGDDRRLEKLTKKDAAIFRAVLDGFPISRMKTKRLAAAPIKKCIEIAESEGLQILSINTKAKYISRISGFFRWLVKRGVCQTNIWEGMHYRPDKEENRRPSYTNEQLNKILASPLYSGFAKDGKEHLPGDQRANDWRHWIPLLCMFTGSRITEIAQLHVDDIEKLDGRLIGSLEANRAKGKLLKTKKSKRLVVFHSKLIEAGFEEYWQGQLDRSKIDGNMQLFPELVAGKRPQLGSKPGRWYRDYLVKIGVKDKHAADGIGSHSFRHRLSDEMRRAGYLDYEFGQIVMGHSNNLMTSEYGAIVQGTVARLGPMIDAVKFEGVDFSTIVKTTD